MAGHHGDKDHHKAFGLEEYGVVVDMNYSIITLTSCNNTHLYMEMIESASQNVSDWFYLIKF